MAERVIVDGVEYLRADSGDLKIVVLDRGFVVVGRVSIVDSYVVINDCRCVRRWGTTKGLGQLAASGPQANTVLDPQPRTRVLETQVIQMIDCVEESWNK